MKKLMIFLLIASSAAQSPTDGTKSKRIMSEEELLRELFNPNMTEKAIRNRNLMEEIDKSIPDDQLGAFWEKVENKSQRLDEATAHMNEEEARKYLLEAYAKETPPHPAYMPPAPKKVVPKAPEPVVKVKQVKKEKKLKPKPVPVKEPVDTSKIIKSLVTSINNFLNKIIVIPNFENKVNSWAKENLLSDWPAKQTWSSFKNELEKFNSLLQRFQEKDANIGTKHIDKLSKNEAVVQSLQQLEAKLAREAPLIDVSMLARTGMKKKTKNAIAHVINALNEAMYHIKLLDSLQKIIEDFDPVEKKLSPEKVKIIDRPESISSFPLPSLSDGADIVNPPKLPIDTMQ